MEILFSAAALCVCGSSLQSKEWPPNAAVSCVLVQSVCLLLGRHHLSSRPSQPEVQWPMRKCARISGRGSDKLAMLGAKEGIKKEKGREGERERRHFLRCAVTLKDACWLHHCIRRVLMRALQPPFRVTIITPDDRSSSSHCKHQPRRSVIEQNTESLSAPDLCVLKVSVTSDLTVSLQNKMSHGVKHDEKN